MRPGNRMAPIRAGLAGLAASQISNVEPHPRKTVEPETATARHGPPTDPSALTRRAPKSIAEMVAALETATAKLVTPLTTVYACKVALPVASPSVDQSRWIAAVSPATSTGTDCVARMAPVAASRISTVQAAAAFPELVSTTDAPSRSPDCTAPSGVRETGATA